HHCKCPRRATGGTDGIPCRFRPNGCGSKRGHGNQGRRKKRAPPEAMTKLQGISHSSNKLQDSSAPHAKSINNRTRITSKNKRGWPKAPVSLKKITAEGFIRTSATLCPFQQQEGGESDLRRNSYCGLPAAGAR